MPGKISDAMPLVFLFIGMSKKCASFGVCIGSLTQSASNLLLIITRVFSLVLKHQVAFETAVKEKK